MENSKYNTHLGKRETLNQGSLTRWTLRGRPDVLAPSSSYRNKIGTWNVRTLNEPEALRCVIQEMENLERWEEYIREELYNDIREEKPIDETTDEISEITTEEMERAINSLAKGKFPGEDEIPAELLQALGPSGKQQLRILINDIYTSGTPPKDFTVGVYIPIVKVNKSNKCSDHRTISLISHASKYF
ncbi:craniofacial development protein 2-like [Elysia marginata]|uniref:Craniofacial development protein 2-like n=1 Tax=Elysia marginata TaxID=1093978 RepID=A0AAV4FAN8_9GAST|nr:craniofacial development protein 2-like [Elysia marginata]